MYEDGMGQPDGIKTELLVAVALEAVVEDRALLVLDVRVDFDEIVDAIECVELVEDVELFERVDLVEDAELVECVELEDVRAVEVLAMQLRS